MPNAEHYVQLTIGQMAVRIAMLQAENDALKAQLAAQPKPEPPKEPQP
jgi:uncharacterized small protein (DUF1192 family)